MAKAVTPSNKPKGTAIKKPNRTLGKTGFMYGKIRFNNQEYLKEFCA